MLLAAAQEGAGQPDDAIETLEDDARGQSDVSTAGSFASQNCTNSERRCADAADAYARAAAGANARIDVLVAASRRRSSTRERPLKPATFWRPRS